ncbi:MAG: hypothetical protein ABIV50_05895 [Opitutus sp.]
MQTPPTHASSARLFTEHVIIRPPIAAATHAPDYGNHGASHDFLLVIARPDLLANTSVAEDFVSLDGIG